MDPDQGSILRALLGQFLVNALSPGDTVVTTVAIVRPTTPSLQRRRRCPLSLGISLYSQVCLVLLRFPSKHFKTTFHANQVSLKTLLLPTLKMTV